MPHSAETNCGWFRMASIRAASFGCAGRADFFSPGDAAKDAWAKIKRTRPQIRLLRRMGVRELYNSPMEKPRPIYQWQLRSRSLELGRRTLVMGILNITPDSFSHAARSLPPDHPAAPPLHM